MLRGFSLLVALTLISAGSVFAANTASDNADDAVYADGWQTADNGGSGFGPWTLANTGGSSGHFAGSSVGNADGLDDGINGGAIGDGDIDQTETRSWGTFASNGETADGIRPFTGGALTIGQHVLVDMDNGFIGAGTVGVALQNSSGANLWEFFFAGGQPTYDNNDAGGAAPTPIGFVDEGLSLDFELTGATAYALDIATRGGATWRLGGTLITPGAGTQDIEQIRVFNFDAGAGGSNDAFFNSLAIQPVPEPSTFAFFGAAIIGLTLWRRRR